MFHTPYTFLIKYSSKDTVVTLTFNHKTHLQDVKISRYTNALQTMFSEVLGVHS